MPLQNKTAGPGILILRTCWKARNFPPKNIGKNTRFPVFSTHVNTPDPRNLLWTYFWPILIFGGGSGLSARPQDHSPDRHSDLPRTLTGRKAGGPWWFTPKPGHNKTNHPHVLFWASSPSASSSGPGASNAYFEVQKRHPRKHLKDHPFGRSDLPKSNIPPTGFNATGSRCPGQRIDCDANALFCLVVLLRKCLVIFLYAFPFSSAFLNNSCSWDGFLLWSSHTGAKEEGSTKGGCYPAGQTYYTCYLKTKSVNASASVW